MLSVDRVGNQHPPEVVSFGQVVNILMPAHQGASPGKPWAKWSRLKSAAADGMVNSKSPAIHHDLTWFHHLNGDPGDMNGSQWSPGGVTHFLVPNSRNGADYSNWRGVSKPQSSSIKPHLFLQVDLYISHTMGGVLFHQNLGRFAGKGTSSQLHWMSNNEQLPGNSPVA